MAGRPRGRGHAVAGILAAVGVCASVPAVAVGAWSAPQDVAPATSLIDGHPALAVDARGTAVALLGYGSGLRRAEQVADGAWTRPRSLGPAAGAGLAVTPSGTLTAWSDGIGDTPRILVSSRALDGAWSPAAAVGRAPSRYARIAGVSANARGDAVVSVVDRQSTGTPSLALQRTAGGAWTPLDLAPAAPWARVIVDDAGAMTAVWRDDAPDGSPGLGVLRVAVRAPGGAFAEIPSPSGGERVALDSILGTPSGDALLVTSPAALWTHTAWLRPGGGGFGPPRTIRGVFWGEGSAAMGRDGTAALAWGGPADAGPVRRIEAVVRPPGGDIGPPVRVARLPRPGSVTGPLVAVGDDGWVVVAWSQLRRTRTGRVTGTVWASVRPPGGRFGPATVLNDPALPAALARVAAGPGRAAVVTWTASTGRGYVLQASRREPAPLIARLTTASRDGDARVRLRLTAPSRVALRLLGPTGRVVVRRSRILPAGASTLVLARRRALSRGRYRLQVDARAVSRAARASARLTVATAR